MCSAQINHTKKTMFTRPPTTRHPTTNHPPPRPPPTPPLHQPSTATCSGAAHTTRGTKQEAQRAPSVRIGQFARQLTSLQAAAVSTARRSCCWTWRLLEALLSEVPGPLLNLFAVTASWAFEGNYVATDTCPWGFAGVLFESFKPVAWYATPLTKNDLRKFRASIGASKDNTYLGSSRLPRGRAALVARYGSGSWRASGLIHCQPSKACCGSPTSAPTSTLLPRGLPWTPSGACTLS